METIKSTDIKDTSSYFISVYISEQMFLSKDRKD